MSARPSMFGAHIPPGGAAAGAHRYWRLYITSTAAVYISMAEIELRSAAGGTDLTGSGTASASAWETDVAGLTPDKAVDDSTATKWATYPATYPQWWSYDFGSGAAHAIIELRITPRQDGSHAETPTDFLVQYSDNGSTWTTQRIITGLTWTAAAQTIDVGAIASAASRHWRIYIARGATISGNVSFAEIELRSAAGGTDLTGSGTASASSSFDGSVVPANAVDNSASTSWAANAGLPQWWAYDFGSGVTHKIVEIRLTPRSTQLAQAPTSFTWQSSDNGTTWTSFSFKTTTWPDATPQTFDVTAI